MTKAKSTFRKVVHFLTVGVWRIPLSTLPKGKSFLLKQLRIVLLALRGFGTDKCALRASALTLYSLLAIVPVVAMAFGVARGFGFEDRLEENLTERFPGQEEVITHVVEYAQTLLKSARGGVVAGIGVAVLFFTVVKVFGNIEKSFNDIWGIPKSRTWIRKFTDYLSMMLLLPLLLVLSSALTVVVTSQITAIVDRIALLGKVSELIFTALRFLPFTIIWVAFLMLYVFMPNTRVKFRSALLAAVVAGTAYQLAQWLYIVLQFGVTKYSSIYGGFAALPLFIIWLQTSWLIVLFGAEISFAHQNVATYEFEPDCLKASNSFRKLLALGIMHHQVHNFAEGKKSRTAEEIAQSMHAPLRLVNEMCYELTEAGMLIETKEDDPSIHGWWSQVIPGYDQTYLDSLIIKTSTSQGADCYIDEIRVVPEPSTLVLLSIGALALLTYAHRKRRRR